MTRLMMLLIVSAAIAAGLSCILPFSAIAVGYEAIENPEPPTTAPESSRQTGNPASNSLQPRLAPGTYLVRTIWKGAPLPKVRVEWRRHINDPAPVFYRDTVRFGTAIFTPPSGSYILTAEWRADGNYKRPRRAGDRFAWLGGNPQLVSTEAGGEVTLILEEVPEPPVTVFLRDHESGINGRVTRASVPIANVGVYVYASTESGFKGNDYLAFARADSRGEFSFSLKPGKYFLIARLRTDNSADLGPLHKNDLLGFNPHNPVLVAESHVTVTSVPVYPLRMLRTPAETSSVPPATIVGKICDDVGLPVSGAYAALYDRNDMTVRPMFRSEPTGADGTFRIYVTIPGKYFLGARNGYGEAPTLSGWHVTEGGDTKGAITVIPGDVHTLVCLSVHRISKEPGKPSTQAPALRKTFDKKFR